LIVGPVWIANIFPLLVFCLSGCLSFFLSFYSFFLSFLSFFFFFTDAKGGRAQWCSEERYVRLAGCRWIDTHKKASPDGLIAVRPDGVSVWCGCGVFFSFLAVFSAFFLSFFLSLSWCFLFLCGGFLSSLLFVVFYRSFSFLSSLKS